MKQQGNSKKQLIVTGFHRSGTSMLMQMLRNAGLYCGYSLMPGHPSNPDGHFEDTDIVRIHDEILAANGTDWMYDTSAALDVPEKYQAQIKKKIAGFDSQSSQWGFKDPRACLFLDNWFECLASPIAVIVYRHYASCYRSLRERQAMSLAYSPQPLTTNLKFWTDPELPLRMWLAYNRSVINCKSQHRNRVFLVAQDRLISGYPLVENLVEAFGIDLDSGMPNGIRRSHSRGDWCDKVEIAPGLQKDLDDTWRELLDLSQAPSELGGKVHGRSIEVGFQTGIKTIQQEASRLGLVRSPPHESTQSIHTISPPGLVESSDIASNLFEINQCLENKNLIGAWTLTQSALGKFPFDTRLTIKAGIIQYWLGAPEKAKKYLRVATKKSPENFNAHFQLGIILGKTDSIEESTECFTTCLKLSPGNARVWLELARNFAASNEIEKALEICKKEVSSNSENVQARIMLIRILIDNGRFDEAYDRCLEAINVFKTNPGIYDLMKEIYSCAGKQHESLGCYLHSVYLRLSANRHYLAELFLKIDTLNDLEQREKLTISVANSLACLKAFEIPIRSDVA